MRARSMLRQPCNVRFIASELKQRAGTLGVDGFIQKRLNIGTQAPTISGA
ncbi:hypothetical protein JCP65_04100 [Enterococcus faecium]|nr:hypothetical protein [Enterococcus faecium]QQG23033.1 hypothetical protein JCP65_04100 [Enterococcus faecium]QQG25811.1 hypothetical protein JCP74_04110 [Enterococcus faecium]HAP9537654.1 hypothetical protein [Enterococcus faecium]